MSAGSASQGTLQTRQTFAIVKRALQGSTRKISSSWAAKPALQARGALLALLFVQYAMVANINPMRVKRHFHPV